MDDTARHNVDIFARYGLRQIVNASGTETTKGASPVCPEVIAAVSELVGNSVEMAELQSAASPGHRQGDRDRGRGGGQLHGRRHLHDHFRLYDGQEPGADERLPDTTGLKNEVILQRGHNVTYGGHVEQNIRLTGARMVEIGAATECGVYQLEDAITDKTACALYVVSHHTVPVGSDRLADLR